MWKVHGPCSGEFVVLSNDNFRGAPLRIELHGDSGTNWITIELFIKAHADHHDFIDLTDVDGETMTVLEFINSAKFT